MCTLIYTIEFFLYMIQALKGRVWDNQLLEDASDILMKDFPLDPSAPGGSVHYRKTLLLR